MQLKNIKTVSTPSLGKLPLADKGNVFTPSGKKREHKAGRLPEDGGYHETSTPAKLELTLNLVQGLNPVRYNDIKDEDVTVKLSDGTTHIMPQAFSESPSPISDSDSKLVLMANYSEQI